MSTVNINFDRQTRSGVGFVLWTWQCLCNARGSASDVVTKRAYLNLPHPPAEVWCAECGIRFTKAGPPTYHSPTTMVGLYTPEYAGGGRI